MTNMSIQPLWLTHFIEILLVIEFQLTQFIVGTFSYKAHFRPQISSNEMVPEYTNIFHTLRSKMGIWEFEQNLVLNYQNVLHRYIQLEMDFLDISSLGEAYWYAIKIEQKFKKKNKQDFGSPNQQQNRGKNFPN